MASNTLLLTLNKKAFDVMVSGEKALEFRKPSAWIKTRLKKKYRYVRFTNGYGSDKPYFIADYWGWWESNIDRYLAYRNGLCVDVKEGDIVIHIGQIIETGNLKDASH
jgi:hypothetical protein